ncbi:MAG: hypothetical protein R3F11_00665 [Verrucomicrobiales bacterium]
MLVGHLTVAFEDHNVANVNPPIAGMPPVQKVPLRSAHNAIVAECTRPFSTGCGGWNYVDYYRTGVIFNELARTTSAATMGSAT